MSGLHVKFSIFENPSDASHKCVLIFITLYK